MTEGLYGDTLGEGALVGRYLIEGLASRGGSGAVYRASDDGGELVAIKVLNRENTFSTSALRRFEQELRAVTKLDHEHIVSVYDSGFLHDGRPFIVLEWVEGGPLSNHLASRGALDPPDVVGVARQIAAALIHAHERDIVHRDIKAENIVAICSAEGAWHVKLVDFGIAKLLSPIDGQKGVTTTTILGTPVAMAPEQIIGGEIDGRTDIYGLGVLLFELLTGRPPFVSSEVETLEELHLRAKPPTVSELAAVPRALEALIERCLDKDPDQRFPSARALAGALQTCLERTAAVSSRSVGLAWRVTVNYELEDAGSILGEISTALELAGADIALETATGLLARWPVLSRGVADKALSLALALARNEIGIALDCEGLADDLETWPIVSGSTVGSISIGENVARSLDPASLLDARIARASRSS